MGRQTREVLSVSGTSVRGAVSILVLVGLLWVLPAAARAAWTPYINVSPRNHVEGPAVGIDGTGNAVLMWERSKDLFDHTLQVRVRRPDGTLTPIQVIAPLGTLLGDDISHFFNWSTPLAVNAAGDAVFGWRDTDNHLEGRVRYADGSLSRRMIVASSPSDDPRVGIDSAGGAVFAWTHQPTLDDPILLRARSLSPSGAFGPVQPVAKLARQSHFQMGVDSTSEAIFAWVGTDGAAYVRTLSSAGELGPAQRMSRVGGDADLDAAAVNAGGEAVFTWRQTTSSGSRELVARRRSAGGTLRRFHVLTRGGGVFSQVALNSSGDAVFCFEGGTNALDARTLAPDGTLGPVLPLGTGEICKTGIDSQGNAVFAWSGSPNGTTRVFARTLAANGTLGKTHALSPPSYRGFEADLAVNPAGEAAVTWLEGRDKQIQASFGP